MFLGALESLKKDCNPALIEAYQDGFKACLEYGALAGAALRALPAASRFLARQGSKEIAKQGGKTVASTAGKDIAAQGARKAVATQAEKEMAKKGAQNAAKGAATQGEKEIAKKGTETVGKGVATGAGKEATKGGVRKTAAKLLNRAMWAATIAGEAMDALSGGGKGKTKAGFDIIGDGNGLSLVSLLPYDVDIRGAEGITTIPKSRKAPSIPMEPIDEGLRVSINNTKVAILDLDYDESTDLPPEEEGVAYIVLPEVKRANPQRRDLITLNTTDDISAENGRINSVGSLTLSMA